MKNKVLNKINLILGVLVAFFAGCHCQKHTIKDPGPVAKYGVPQEILDQWEREGKGGQQLNDTVPAQPEQAPANNQAVEEAEEDGPARIDPQPKKYGPMPPTRD